MGGIVSGLFGQSEKSPQTNTQTLTTLTDAQKKLAEQLGPLLEGLVGTKTSASDTEQFSLTALEELSKQLALGGNSTDPTGSAAQTALQQILGSSPTDFSDYYKSTIQDPLMETFTRDIFPQIGASRAGTFFGGERREAEGRATDNLTDELTKQYANLAFQTKQSDTQNKLAAAGLAPSLTSGALATPNANILAQLLGAAQGQRESLEGMDLEKIKAALGYLGTPQIENVVTTTPGRQASGGIIPGIATMGIGSLLGIF